MNQYIFALQKPAGRAAYICLHLLAELTLLDGQRQNKEFYAAQNVRPLRQKLH